MTEPNESPRYPIAAVRERVRRHGRPVLDFAVGPHREPPPTELLDMLRNVDDGWLRTPCSRDELDAFGDAAATMLRRVYGVDVPPSVILPVPGGRTAMSFLASTLIRPGDDVGIAEPAYPAFARVAHQIHARIHPVPLDPERGFEPAAHVLTAEEAAEISFVALNYPNNPTGAVISEQALGIFLENFAPGTIVFNDATYGPLVFDQSPWSVFAGAHSLTDRFRFVELHSLAKHFALGPLSVAFLVGEQGIIAELGEYAEYAWSDQSSLEMKVALTCLEDGDRFTRIRAIYADRLDRLGVVLSELGFEPFPPASGMYIVCRTPSVVGGIPVADAGEAALALLNNHNVAVVPWEVHPTSYLRFSSQYAEDDLQALASLGAKGPLAS